MRRFSVVLGGLFLAIALSAAVSTASHQQSAEAAVSPQVALDWNATAVATTIAAGKSQPESGLYVGLTQAAVYDAVIAVDAGFHPYLIVPGFRRGRPTKPQPPLRPTASSSATSRHRGRHWTRRTRRRWPGSPTARQRQGRPGRTAGRCGTAGSPDR